MGVFKRVVRRLVHRPSKVGRQGEATVARKLGWVNFCGYEGKTLRNLYVPLGNGQTSEIDLLYITRKGLVVVESKNYGGYIFGDENSRNWVSSFYAGRTWLGRTKVERHPFYNPIWQNETHIRALERYLGGRLPAVSAVVFSSRCEFKHLEYDSPEVLVCHEKELPRYIRQLWRNSEDVFTDDEVEELWKTLSALTEVSRATKKQHVREARAAARQSF